MIQPFYFPTAPQAGYPRFREGIAEASMDKRRGISRAPHENHSLPSGHGFPLDIARNGRSIFRADGSRVITLAVKPPPVRISGGLT
jgi:hypothetical protein